MDYEELTPEWHRTAIVLKAISLGNLTVAEAEQIDVLVCSALGIDSEDPPPQFILDSQMCA